MAPRTGSDRDALSLVVPRTAADVPLVTLENSASKLPLRVSPSTSVPDRNATPMNTARNVPASRRFRAHSPLNVTLPMTLLSAPERLYALQDSLSGGLVHAVDEAAVRQEQDLVGVTRGYGIMGHHHDRLAELVDRLAHELEELGTGA